jgi:hypothetical protein
MKKLHLLQPLFFLLILGAACKKGDTGPVGTPRTDGRDGNAKVIQINYGARTFSGVSVYNLPDTIRQGFIDSSLVLVYYNPQGEPTNAWYPIPGLGSGGIYEIRNFTGSTGGKISLSVRLMNSDGSGTYLPTVTFLKLRILIAPASTIVMGPAALRPDVKIYDQVRTFYDLAD